MFIRRIGSGKLIGPKGITTTPRGSVIVADNKGNQVLEFSINGRLIRKIQSVKNDKVRVHIHMCTMLILLSSLALMMALL